ncbi:MAG TPA: hypothetical protein PLO78_00990 [Candidatus Omnitrophota bacterium]|nr:hypothetical protein [Candidatus Omnitrophota bacterium]
MITIAWDVDDVLNDLMRVWFDEKWKIEHPECGVQYETITKNPPPELLGISLEEYRASLDEFRLSGKYKELTPVAEVLKWFEACGHLFRHIAVTAVPIKAASVSADWVMCHFGTWIRTFHMVPSPRKTDSIPQYDQNKIDFLKWFGKVDVFMDDCEANIVGCAQAGIKGIVFPRPWNGNRSTVSQVLHSLGSLPSHPRALN